MVFNVIKMTTEDNLKDAFAGESQANRKYLAFAKKADEEGMSQVAKLFRAAADAETVHAMNHLRALKEVGTTEENLEKAVNGEVYEYTDMYPRMIDDAKEEGEQAALASFRMANDVEKIHAELYKKALESVNSGKDLEGQDLFVCQACGHTAEGEAPDRCPVCGAPKEQYKKVE
jgi:rubrerythrin